MTEIPSPRAVGTDRPDGGDRLRRAEMLLRVAGRVGRIGGWSVDMATGRVDWSDEVCAIHEVAAGHVPAIEEAIAFYAPEWRARLRACFEACARDGTPYDLELEIVTARGRRLWVHVGGEAVRDAAGRIVEVQGAFQDIDSRKRGEQALAAARRQSDLIVSSIAVGIQMVDAAGRVLRQNPAAGEMLGWDEQDVVGKHSELLDARGPGDTESAIRLTLRDGQPRQVADATFRRRDGRAFPVFCVCSPLRDDSGAVGGAVISFRDVSTRQRNAALRASDAEVLEMVAAGAPLPAVLERIVLAIEAFADGATASVLLLDAESGRVRHGAAPRLPDSYNAAIDGMTIGPGMGSCGTAMHRGEAVVVADIDTDPLWDPFRELARAHGLRACWSVPVKNAAGDVLASFALYYREPRAPREGEVGLMGRFAHLVAIAIDRTRTFESLRERVKELRCLYRVLDLTSDYTRSVEDICREVARVLPQALLRDDLAVAWVQVEGAEYRCDAWREPAAALRVPIAAGSDAAGFVEIGYPAPLPEIAGTDKPFLAEEVAMVSAVAAHIGRMLDSRRLAARLTQSERLSAIGELTGGVAHDFNNLLTVILGNAELLGEALADTPALARFAEMTRNAAERGADLTRHLLAFARRQPLAPQVTDVDALVAGMGTLLQRTLGEHVQMVMARGEGLWRAVVDPAQLESALLNLCLNARDAMPDGGRLTVELSNVQLDGSYASWHDDVAPGPYVLVAVSDTGIGMTAAVAARAFEPFFTTKEIGHGSGLGLSMVYGFVKQSRGHVKIYSEVGQGTTVKLYLPRAPHDADRRSAAVAAAVEGGSERILLVEDDELVRDHVAALLRALGYRVVSVADGAAALEVLRADAPFDLLFTDVVMPGGMNGRQLADSARRLFPDLPVLFTSGYTENALQSQGRLDPGVLLLHKPYRRPELAAKLREALDRRH
ncbi:MAG: PAS domain S-box protein [Rhodospirillales bacterium]